MTNKYKSIPRTGWVLEGRIISMELLVLGATDSQANPWIISVSSRREGWSETTRHSFCRLQVLRYIFMPPFWEGRGWASITWTSKGKRFIFYITFKQKKMDVIHLFFSDVLKGARTSQILYCVCWEKVMKDDMFHIFSVSQADKINPPVCFQGLLWMSLWMGFQH